MTAIRVSKGYYNNLRLAIGEDVLYFNPNIEGNDKDIGDATKIFFLEDDRIKSAYEPPYFLGSGLYENFCAIDCLQTGSTEIWCSPGFKKVMQEQFKKPAERDPNIYQFTFRKDHHGKVHWLHPDHIVAGADCEAYLLVLNPEAPSPLLQSGIVVVTDSLNMIVGDAKLCLGHYEETTIPSLDLAIFDYFYLDYQPDQLIKFIDFLKPSHLHLRSGIHKASHHSVKALMSALDERKGQINLIEEHDFEL